MEDLISRARIVNAGFQDLKRRYDAFITDPTGAPPVLIVHDRHLELAALVEDLAVQIGELSERVTALEKR